MAEVWSGIIETVKQLGGMIPDSVLFGSIVLFFVTLNTSIGVFAIFILELIISHKFISWMFTETTGPDKPNLNIDCYGGYKSMRKDVARMIARHQYPSYSFFSITAMATYLGMATNTFSDTMKSMDKSLSDSMRAQWESRPFVAYMFILAILVVFFIVRLTSSCDGAGELIIAFVCAVACGALFFKINTMFFGEESVNFLGLPSLVSRQKEGDPIYVCSKN